MGPWDTDSRRHVQSMAGRYVLRHTVRVHGARQGLSHVICSTQLELLCPWNHWQSSLTGA